MKLIKQYEFKDYPMEVQISLTRRGKYYFNDEKLPKKYIKYIGNTLDLEYKILTINKTKVRKEILVDMFTREPIYKNERYRHTGRSIAIRGQALHELTLLPHHRSIIVEHLKNYFISNMIKQGVVLEKINELYLELIFNTDIRYLSAKWNLDLPDESVGDLDNHELFYKKVLFDCIQKKVYRKEDAAIINNPIGIIPCDNARYLNDYRVIYNHTENEKNLIFNIYDKSPDK